MEESFQMFIHLPALQSPLRFWFFLSQHELLNVLKSEMDITENKLDN